jgi:hypothetical protein
MHKMDNDKITEEHLHDDNCSCHHEENDDEIGDLARQVRAVLLKDKDAVRKARNKRKAAKKKAVAKSKNKRERRKARKISV